MAHSVSVIIPAFNRLELLKGTLRSILAQTVRPYEVIVVDDHSEDNTVEFLRTHFREDVVVVTNKGKGPGAARNTGLELATGDFVRFFDSDDVLSQDSIEHQSMTLAASSAGALYSPYVFAAQDESGRWVAHDSILHYHPFDGSRSLNYWMVRGLFIAIPAMLFKREILKDIGPWSEETVA